MSRVKVNEITNKVATGPVDFPDGITGVALTVTGNVTVGGTIISEDTTNVDSVGWVTARNGLNVGPPATGIGATIQSVGDAVFAGVCTAVSFSGDGSSLTGVASTDNIITSTASTFASINATGIVTATEFIPTEGQLANRNVIINGAMAVAQRGTSQTDVENANGYGQWPDRFREFLNTSAKAGVWTISQSTEAPDGFAKSTKWDCTTAGTLAADSYGGFEQYIEGFNVQRFAKGTSGAKPGVLSFYVKTNKTGTYAVEFRDNDNTRMVGGTYTVGDTNWNRYEVAMPADTTGAWGDDNGSSLWIRWWLVAGSNFTSGTARTAWAAGISDEFLAAGQTVDLSDSTSNEWHIAGVQLEVGSVATPFEHRNYREELFNCLRYYHRTGEGASAAHGTPLAQGWARTATLAQLTVTFPVPMREAPSAIETTGTAADYDVSNVASGFSCDAVPTFDGAGTTQAHVYFQVSGSMTVGGGARGVTDGAGKYIAFSAEL